MPAQHSDTEQLSGLDQGIPGGAGKLEIHERECRRVLTFPQTIPPAIFPRGAFLQVKLGRSRDARGLAGAKHLEKC